MSSICPDPDSTRSQTRIIAHRGASGYLPEHTAAAKILAYGLGADFIEQDLVATRDEKLVVLHDTYLNDVSDVATVYPGRQRDDGRYYVIDFTLDELLEVSLVERRRPDSDELRYPGRFPYDLDTFRILGFDEEVRLISGLNASTGGHVGIYPEIKDPGWHGEAGIDLTRLVHDELTALQSEISGPVFVQSFDATSLKRMREEFASDYPLVQLLDAEGARGLTANRDAMDSIADYAVGIGLPFDTLISTDEGGALVPSVLATELGDAGLLVHPYTLRRDVPPPRNIDYFAALRFLIREIGVDALFCDHPDDGVAVRSGNRV